MTTLLFLLLLLFLGVLWLPLASGQSPLTTSATTTTSHVQATTTSHRQASSADIEQLIQQRRLQADYDPPPPVCPLYRTFDVNQPDAVQFGDNVPDGCRCIDGMQGLNCGYCNGNDAPCQQQSGAVNNATTISAAPHICHRSVVFQPGESYKSFQCKLFSTLEQLFTNGKISLFVDIVNKSAALAIYNTASINHQHAIDCVLWDCDFPLGQSRGFCQNSMCQCTDVCSDWTTQIVETMISNKPTTVLLEPTAYEHHMKVIMDGAPMEIEALCNASACMVDPNYNNNTNNNNNIVQQQDDLNSAAAHSTMANVDSQWSVSATFSLVVLSIIVVLFLLLVACAAVPFVLGTRQHVLHNNRNKRSSTSTRQQQHPPINKRQPDNPHSDNHPPPRNQHQEHHQQQQQSLVGNSEAFVEVRLNKGHQHSTKNTTPTTKTTTNNTTIPKKHRYNELYDTTTTQVLEFRHLSRVVRLRSGAAKAYGQTRKIILNNISGSVESGTLLGIMGPSGSGKSSLLNILAAVESDSSYYSRISGQILLNGKLQKRGYRTAVAYVQQDDSLYETLTVHECIEYSAMLRLPRQMKTEEKDALVWKTLEELHLAEIAHNRIGSTGKNNAGVSGGERKRVSVGMELVSQARVLVLDEPTSGLDSHAANNIINVLSELASRNRIVMLSIHQPSMKSFLAMGQVLLLGRGRVMYNGKPSEVGRYLEQQGFPCPPLETVADHMLSVVSEQANCDLLKGPEIVPSDYEKLSESKRAGTDDDEEESTTRDGDGEDILVEQKSLLNEIVVLLFRTAKDIFRNRELFLLQITISVLLALFAGGIFNDVSNNLAGFQNRMGAFYFTLSFFAFASFSSMDIFVRERHIFVRESGSKYYRAFSYFLAKILLDTFVLRVIPVTIFTFIFYWMMGLRGEPETFVIFWATLVLFNVCSGTISICISIATPSVGQANLIAAVWFLIMLLFGGFLVNVQTMSPWYAWVKYISIFYYSFEILMTNELSGMVLSFDAPGYPPLPIYGEVFLATIGMETNNQTRDLICLCSLAAGFSVAAYFLLLLRVPPSAARQFRRMHRENRKLARGSGSDDEYDKEDTSDTP